MSESKKRYDKEHTKQIALKLNKRTDADILARLGRVGNMQGYIKKLIRKDAKETDADIQD